MKLIVLANPATSTPQATGIIFARPLPTPAVPLDVELRYMRVHADGTESGPFTREIGF